MTSKTAIVRLAIAACIAPLAGCAAQLTSQPAGPAAGDWDAVTRVKAGAAVAVLDSSGAATVGRLLVANGDRIAIRTAGGDITVARSAVRRVSIQSRQTGRMARWGFVMGATTGVLVGAVATESNRLPWAVFLGGGWGGIGAAIGGLEGRSQTRDVVVYAR